MRPAISADGVACLQFCDGQHSIKESHIIAPPTACPGATILVASPICRALCRLATNRLRVPLGAYSVWKQIIVLFIEMVEEKRMTR
jgi:hypothetical protein